MDRSWDRIAKTPFPAGAVVQYTPNQYGWTGEVFRLDDTFEDSIPPGMPTAGGESMDGEDGAGRGAEREAELKSAGSFWSSGGTAGPHVQGRQTGAAGPYAEEGGEGGDGKGPTQGTATSSGLQQAPAREGSRNLRRFSLGTL